MSPASWPEYRDPRDASGHVPAAHPSHKLPPLDRHVPDLRLEPGPDDPWPATHAGLATAVEALDAGQDYRSTLEQLLRTQPDARADAFMLLLKESRGAWAPFLRQGGGRALLIGNAISGTASALVSTANVDLVQLDRSPLRLAFAAYRNHEHVGARTQCVVAGDGPCLPFADQSFDVVVLEGGLPSAASPYAFAYEELLRVCRGELVLTLDNRFGYKRSTGRRGRFSKASPWGFAKRLLQAPPGERTLWGYRRLLRKNFSDVRAFSLYPHTRDFTHVVGLDEARPRLTIGPRERQNIAKCLGHRVGLFPHLTPSFLIRATRGERAKQPVRMERVLAALAERLGEPQPQLDLWVATRSNTALGHCLPRGFEGASTYSLSDIPEAGRWTLHLPLSPRKRGLLRKHQGFLNEVRRRFPQVPVPEPLFLGEIEGVWLGVERRQLGLTAPHLTQRRGPTARMFEQAARHMADLVLERGPLQAACFDQLVAPRLELVARNCGHVDTAREVRRMTAELREQLVGQELPLCLYHGDLRSKHVQVREDGSVVAFLDWGAGEARFLPLLDLLHLVAHQRKQETGCSPAATWHLVRDRKDLRPHEREALALYAQLTGLEEPARRAIERAYPILVAGMAETNWDFSRPHWVRRSFGIGT